MPWAWTILFPPDESNAMKRTLVIGLGFWALLSAGPGLTDIQTVTPAALTAAPWSWQQSQMNDGALIRPANPDRYQLRFHPDGTLAIQADCNRAQASYRLEESRLHLELGPTTLMACDEDSLGDRFLIQLGAVSLVFFSGGTTLHRPEVRQRHHEIQPP
jgi:heat shock protein HslJ